MYLSHCLGIGVSGPAMLISSLDDDTPHASSQAYLYFVKFRITLN